MKSTNNNLNSYTKQRILTQNTQTHKKQQQSSIISNQAINSQQKHKSHQSLSSQSTRDNISQISCTSSVFKSDRQTSFLSDNQINQDHDEQLQKDIKQQINNINTLLGKNQMNIIFKFLTMKNIIVQLRIVCKSWKVLIESYILEQTPLLINERNELDQLISTQMESETSHTRYVRAFKKVSLGHDLIFNLGLNEAEQFYLLKDKSEFIKEIRSIIHQIIGVKVIEKNKEIKKYSVQYYMGIIQGCKDVSVDEIPKDIINRMRNIVGQNKNQVFDDVKLQSLSQYAYALKILIQGYLHLQHEMNPLYTQKIRVESLKNDIHSIKKYNQQKSMHH